jgi:hypothetical protein
MERLSHGGLVHATACRRPEAHTKWIVMKCIEILMSAGDVHFNRSTLKLELRISAKMKSITVVLTTKPF